MPIVIIAILGIALVLYARKRNSDEIRRIREKAERDAALLEREAREVEERCAGRPVDEQVRICEEFSARLEADMKRHEARAREIEKARKAAEEARSKEYDMSPGTKGKRCCSWRVPPWEAWPAGGQAARPGGEACRAAAVTTATTALKAGAGTARTTANCGSVFCVEAFALRFP